MSKKHRGLVQRQFTKTLDAFSRYAVRDSAEVLAERVSFAKPNAEDLALDVACGPGTVVLALAPLVKFAYGLDVTAAMLARARENQLAAQVPNAAFTQGDAEQLPYPSGVFTLVTCQFALHHMLKPEAVLKEMVRVARTGGRLMIVDTLGPESDEKWELQNRIESLRDPSHTTSLRLTTFLDLFERAGLEVVRQSQKRRPSPFNKWMQRANLAPGDARYKEVLGLIESSIATNAAGYSAAGESADLLITHYEGVFLLRRPCV